MGKIQAGILSKVSGKVAGVVGAGWKDKAYLRAYVIPSNPNSEDQQTQRGQMRGIVAFAKPLVGPVFNAYTDMFQKSMSGFNFFIKRNIATYVEGYSGIGYLITEGKLWCGGLDTAAYNSSTGNCIFGFDSSVGNNGANNDKMFALVYDKSTGLFYFATDEVNRSTATITVPCATGLTATNLCAYLFAAQYYKTQVVLISNNRARICSAS